MVPACARVGPGRPGEEGRACREFRPRKHRARAADALLGSGGRLPRRWVRASLFVLEGFRGADPVRVSRERCQAGEDGVECHLAFAPRLGCKRRCSMHACHCRPRAGRGRAVCTLLRTPSLSRRDVLPSDDAARRRLGPIDSLWRPNRFASASATVSEGSFLGRDAAAPANAVISIYQCVIRQMTQALCSAARSGASGPFGGERPSRRRRSPGPRPSALIVKIGSLRKYADCPPRGVACALYRLESRSRLLCRVGSATPRSQGRGAGSCCARRGFLPNLNRHRNGSPGRLSSGAISGARETVAHLAAGIVALSDRARRRRRAARTQLPRSCDPP